MATLYIREYHEQPVIQGNALAVAQEPGIADQTVTYTGTAGTSTAFNTNTRFLGISSDGVFSYVVGSAPTATTSHLRVAAGQLLYVGVLGGQKISAIVNT